MENNKIIDILSKILERVPRSDSRQDVTRHTILRRGFLNGNMQFSTFADVCERAGIDLAEAIGREIERVEFLKSFQSQNNTTDEE